MGQPPTGSEAKVVQRQVVPTQDDGHLGIAGRPVDGEVEVAIRDGFEKQLGVDAQQLAGGAELVAVAAELSDLLDKILGLDRLDFRFAKSSTHPQGVEQTDLFIDQDQGLAVGFGASEDLLEVLVELEGKEQQKQTDGGTEEGAPQLPAGLTGP